MNILCVKQKETAVSYYRGAGVINELCRANGWNVDSLYYKEITQDSIHKYDLLFDIRPTSQESIYAIYLAKRAGVKVWIDVDDLLWKIPGANPVARGFNEQSLDNLTRAMLNADMVTVSTDELAVYTVQQFGVDVITVPNAWNDRIDDLPDRWNEPKGNQIHILCRGSNTHIGDWLYYRDYFRDSDKYYFQFVGEFPSYFFKKYGGHLETINWQAWRSNILEYFQLIGNLKPQYFFFPLEDNPFNRCKSNIAWIEATMAGAACIASPEMPEFLKVPAITDLSIFDEIEEKNECAAQKFKESCAYIRKNLRLSLVNKQRAQIVKHLIK